MQNTSLVCLLLLFLSSPVLAEMNRLEKVMNHMTALLKAPNFEDCLALDKLLAEPDDLDDDGIEETSENPIFKNIQRKKNELCESIRSSHHSNTTEHVRDNGDPIPVLHLDLGWSTSVNTSSSTANNPNNNIPRWKRQPNCQAHDKTFRCRYNHSSGRGLFILRQPTFTWEKRNSYPTPWPQYLVCAQGAYLKSFGAIGHRVEVLHSCRISTVLFDQYLKTLEHSQSPDIIAPNELDMVPIDLRSDVMGLIRWTLSPGRGKALAIPNELGEQCQGIFSDAYYCSPTLIVLPTYKGDKVDVCTMKADIKRFTFIVASFSRVESQWFCQRMDIGKPIIDEDHHEHKTHCIPHLNGEIHSSCILPYIPVRQEVHLVRSFRHWNYEGGVPHHYSRVGVKEDKNPRVDILPVLYNNLTTTEPDEALVERSGPNKINSVAFINHENSWVEFYPRTISKKFNIWVEDSDLHTDKKIYIVCADNTQIEKDMSKYLHKKESTPFEHNCEDGRVRYIGFKIHKLDKYKNTRVELLSYF